MEEALRDPEIARMARNSIRHAAAATTEAAEAIMPVSASTFSDPAYHHRELNGVFRRLPLMLAPSCELPRPGDFKTMTVASVPVLIVRGKDGRIRAFLNSCSHRGAAVATKPSGNAGRFTCAYHGWTFGQKGELLGIASSQDFGHADRSCLGLKPFPAEERAGLIFVTLDDAPRMTVDEYLADFAPLVAHFELEKWHFFDSRALPSANWKLAYDATIDYYHVPALHKDTLAAGGGYSNRALYYPFGPHQRLMNPDSRLARYAEMPEEDWPAEAVMAGNWSIFPNVTLAAFNGGFTDAFGNRRAMLIMQILPGETPGTSVTNQLYLLERAPENEEIARAAQAQFDMLGMVVDTEDNAVGFTQQKALETGFVDHILYGRNEGGMQAFHGWLARVVAASDDEIPGLFREAEPIRA